MRVLLDTHLWLWWLLGSPQLPNQQRQAIDRSAQARQLHLAAISLWEAQTLQAKGRLQLNQPFEPWLRQAAAPELVTVLPLATCDRTIRLSQVVPLWSAA